MEQEIIDSIEKDVIKKMIKKVSKDLKEQTELVRACHSLEQSTERLIKAKKEDLEYQRKETDIELKKEGKLSNLLELLLNYESLAE